ncbi:prephenate dehydrogenase [Streptomyces armeniacus]|uniref:Prephenate dehydrogenase n=1 Tax=Streptomyces armeniacus TaxID=83291 RepID=A0A345XV67_9ACTN|nr:prephenate dehydrogenase [Streptomyces armeniacus]AXK35533.1 prephenate dehydrogenase [Streptomyces armeniacus]
MRTALVIGTGLIGTSAALALAARGVRVHLRDHDPERARTAAALGAGTDRDPEGRVDLALVAVPPARVAEAVLEAQRQDVARGYLDVGSVKGSLRGDLRAGGCDPASYLGTHPMAGSEKSGPLAATADLFEGRPWVLTPTTETDTEVLNLALELVALCRAVPVVMDADAHDRAVALVSHTPQLLSSMVAARLEKADETAVRLCGQGIRDVTRIAASDSAMWLDILAANPGPVADVLEELAADLEGTVQALRGLQSADEEKHGNSSLALANVLTRGREGSARVPGKHGQAPATYETVAVLISDRPGELARIFADAGAVGVNIEDVRIEHATGQQAGHVQLMVESGAAQSLATALRERGWALRTQ